MKLKIKWNGWTHEEQNQEGNYNVAWQDLYPTLDWSGEGDATT